MKFYTGEARRRVIDALLAAMPKGSTWRDAAKALPSLELAAQTYKRQLSKQDEKKRNRLLIADRMQKIRRSIDKYTIGIPQSAQMDLLDFLDLEAWDRFMKLTTPEALKRYRNEDRVGPGLDFVLGVHREWKILTLRNKPTFGAYTYKGGKAVSTPYGDYLKACGAPIGLTLTRLASISKWIAKAANLK